MRPINYTVSTVMSALRTGEDDEELNNGEDGQTVGTYMERLAKLNAIGDHSEQVRVEAGELEEWNEDGSTTPIVPEKKVEAVETSAVQTEVKPTVEAQPQKIMRKINGQDVEITEEMLVKAQKIAAADVYLEEAARARNEALAAKQKPSVEDVTAQEKSAEDLKAFYVEKANAIQMGTPEEAAEVLRELLEKKQAPVIDEAAIARKIDEKLSASESQRAFNEAFSKFKTEYKDIVEDPMAWELAKQLDNNLIRSGDKRDFYERFKASGDAVRDWLGKAKTPVAELSKEQRKASAPSVPKQATASHNSQQVEEKEESAAELIAKMKAHRERGRGFGGGVH